MCNLCCNLIRVILHFLVVHFRIRRFVRNMRKLRYFRVWLRQEEAWRSISRRKKTATMAEISLYLTNVNVSLGQATVEQVGKQPPLYAVLV